MDAIAQLLLLGAGIALYAWADRKRLLVQACAKLEPMLQRCSAVLQRIGVPIMVSVGSPSTVSVAARGLLTEGWRWLLVGAPGSGKTTAARQIVRGYLRAGAAVTILDPDGGAWPRGCHMIGAPDDYEAIRQELEQVSILATARRAEFQRGVRLFDAILVLVDEAPVVLRRTPGAVEQIADLARRGRKLGISLILLAQDTQTRTLGLEGQSQLLDAFERLDCRMTPTGVVLFAGDVLRSTTPLDHGATDLVLPLVDEQPSVPSNPSLPLVEKLLAQALIGSNTIATTPVAADCNAQSGEHVMLRNEALQGPNLTDSLPAEVAQQIALIDWRTVATLVEANAVGETAALRALGFPPSSTSMKYQVARARLHSARALLNEG